MNTLTEQMQEITNDLEQGVISDDVLIRVGDLICEETKAFKDPVDKVMAVLAVALEIDKSHSPGEHVETAVATAFTLGMLYGREHHRRGYDL